MNSAERLLERGQKPELGVGNQRLISKACIMKMAALDGTPEQGLMVLTLGMPGFEDGLYSSSVSPNEPQELSQNGQMERGL